MLKMADGCWKQKVNVSEDQHLDTDSSHVSPSLTSKFTAVNMQALLWGEKSLVSIFFQMHNVYSLIAMIKIVPLKYIFLKKTYLWCKETLH